MKSRLLTVLSACVLLFCSLATAYGAQVVSMGTFYTSGEGTDISGDGQIVVGSFTGSGSSVLTYWTPTQGLVTVNGVIGTATGISRDGTTFVGGGTQGNFLYSNGTGFVGLPNTSGQTLALGLQATGVSDDGSFVAGGQQYGAMVWDSTGNPTLISEGKGSDISGDGTVVVGQSTVSSTLQATRWEFDSLLGVWGQTTLTTGTGGGWAHAVSQDGSIVFGVAAGNAFRWIEGVGTEDINDSYLSSNVWGVTANGAIAAGNVVGLSSVSEAAIWDATNGWQTLESLLLAAGLSSGDIPYLDFAGAISSDGRYIVAVGDDKGYWIDLGAPLTTVPIPATAWLFGSGLLGLTSIVRRKKTNKQNHTPHSGHSFIRRPPFFGVVCPSLRQSRR